MGGKKKGGSAHTPYEAPNTLYSKQIVKILDVLSEGPVEGLANGDTHPFKSTFFNDTPVQSENGDFNFKGFELAINDGDQDQVYLPEFDVVEKTNQVNADVKQDTPITRTVTDPYVSSVRVTVGVKGLVEMKDNGDRLPTSVTMTVSILKAGNYHASKVVTIHEKGTETYYQDVTFNDLPEAPFDIRVARVTPDSKTDKIQNATIFPSFVETIDAKLSYPFLAMAGYKFDAMQFGSSLPRINTLLKGRIVQIPTNYDPINRIYTGMWDGSFKLGWTDNPAWIIYDFITNERYGGKIDPRYVDRAALYRVSQFCDELVDDGYGGKEPRVTFNAYYTDDKKFRDRLQDMCSAFFGHAIWNGKYLSFTLDNDEDPVALYTNANVVDGNFSYEGISNSAVITTVHVQYIDKNDAYRQKTEVVEDRDLLRRYRTNVQKVVAEGCTSRSQAHRLGRYILEKSRLRQTISFRIGAEGLKHRPFDVIQIADNHLAGTNIGGRVMAIEGKTVTLDREVENANKGTFSYLGVEEGKLKKIDLEITEQIDSKKLRLKEIPEDLRKFSAWSLSRSDVKPKYYRALGISQGNDGTFSIKAIEHEVGLQDRLASGLKFEEDPNSIWSSFPEITNNTIGNDGDTVVINWENINSDTTALTYIVKLYKDGKLYRKYEDLAEPNLRFEGLPDGEYVVEIQARNSRGQLSNTLKDYFSLNYTITEVTADPDFWAVKLNWKLPTIVNVDVSTEIWRSETDNFNDARLRVTLPYPTSTHKDEGMSIGDQYYYFLRIIDKTGKTGELVGPISGQPKQANEGKELLGYLQGQITTKELDSGVVDQIIEDTLKEIDIDTILSPDQVDALVEEIAEKIDSEYIAKEVIENVKADADEIIKDSQIIAETNNRIDDNEMDLKLLELSKITSDAVIYAETQTNKVSIDDNYAELVLQKIVEATNNKLLANQYLSLVAENEIAKAEYLLSQLAQATTDKALVQEIRSLTASFLENRAEIKELREVTATEFEATARDIEEMSSEMKRGDDLLASELILSKLSQVTGDHQLSQQVLTLIAENEQAKAELMLAQMAQTTETKAIVQEILSLSADFLENKAEIEAFRKATATEFEATASSVEKLHAEVNRDNEDFKADLLLSKMSQATGDAQLAQQYLSLLVQNENAKAEFILSQIAKTTDNKAILQEINSLTVSFLENKASIESLKQVVAEENLALAQEVISLKTDVAGNKSEISSVKQSVSTLDKATATAINNLKTDVAGNKSEISDVKKAQTNDRESFTQQLNSASSEWKSANEVKYLTSSDVEKTPREYADLYGRTTVVEFGGRAHFGLAVGSYHTVTTTISYLTGLDRGRVTQRAVSNDFAVTVRERKSASDDTWSPWIEIEDVAGAQKKADAAQKEAVRISKASIDSLAQTQANDKQALANDISRVQASVDSTNAKVTQNSTAIANVDGTVKSQYTLTTEATVNGQKVVSGFTSINDGKTSEFIVQADKFAIVNKKNGEQKMPFVIVDNKLAMDGDMIATGSISGNKLVAGTSIQAPVIKGGRVESGHFAGGSINIGNGNFNVDSNGDLDAKSGTFRGTVFAKKIKGGIVDIVEFYAIRADREDIDVGRPIRYHLPADDMDYIYTIKPFLVKVTNGNVHVRVVRDDGVLIARGTTGSGYWSHQEFLISDISEADIVVQKGTSRYVDISMTYSGARGSYAHIKGVIFQRVMRTEAPIRLTPIKQ